MSEKSHGWREFGAMPELHPSAAAYLKGPCRVITSREQHGKRMRWHMSISCADRYPTWDEIHDARYALIPLGITVAQILPPPHEYVNRHQFCFHLWEIDDGEW